MSTRFRVSSFLLLGLILIFLAACTALPPATPDGAAATPTPPGCQQLPGARVEDAASDR